MLPSLQEITPLPLSRVYSPLIVPPFIADSLQWLSIGPWAGPHLLLSRSTFSGFLPMCPIIAKRLHSPSGMPVFYNMAELLKD